MKQKKVWPYFLLALAFKLLSATTLISFPFLFFSPFFALAYSRLTKITSLGVSACIGLLMDSLSSDYPFGFYSITYVIATLLLYRQRIYFVDKPIGLCCFTSVFSLVITAIHYALLPFFALSLPFKAHGVFTDFFLLPLADAFYAFFFFCLPSICYQWLKKGWFYFLFFVKRSKHKDRSTKHQASV